MRFDVTCLFSHRLTRRHVSAILIPRFVLFNQLDIRNAFQLLLLPDVADMHSIAGINCLTAMSVQNKTVMKVVGIVKEIEFLS